MRERPRRHSRFRQTEIDCSRTRNSGGDRGTALPAEEVRVACRPWSWPSSLALRSRHRSQQVNLGWSTIATAAMQAQSGQSTAFNATSKPKTFPTTLFFNVETFSSPPLPSPFTTSLFFLALYPFSCALPHLRLLTPCRTTHSSVLDAMRSAVSSCPI